MGHAFSSSESDYAEEAIHCLEQLEGRFDTPAEQRVWADAINKLVQIRDNLEEPY